MVRVNPEDPQHLLILAANKEFLRLYMIYKVTERLGYIVIHLIIATIK